MSSFLRQTLRAAVLMAVVMGMGTATPGSDKPAANAGETPTARMMPEVRLRKLHLVRPDLIPYPIAYEIYC